MKRRNWKRRRSRWIRIWREKDEKTRKGERIREQRGGGPEENNEGIEKNKEERNEGEKNKKRRK